MPKTNAICLLKLFWVSWVENDFGSHGRIRYGWTEWHARLRAAKGYE